MDKKGQMGLPTILIGALVILILGVITIAITDDIITDQTRVEPVVDDTFTASNVSCTQVTTRCIQTGTLADFANATGGQDIGAGNFSSCNILGQPSGILLLGVDDQVNLDYNGQTVNATYSQISCSFIQAGITRTILNFVPLLIAVILFVFTAALIKT